MEERHYEREDFRFDVHLGRTKYIILAECRLGKEGLEVLSSLPGVAVSEKLFSAKKVWFSRFRRFRHQTVKGFLRGTLKNIVFPCSRAVLSLKSIILRGGA